MSWLWSAPQIFRTLSGFYLYWTCVTLQCSQLIWYLLSSNLWCKVFAILCLFWCFPFFMRLEASRSAQMWHQTFMQRAIQQAITPTLKTRQCQSIYLKWLLQVTRPEDRMSAWHSGLLSHVLSIVTKAIISNDHIIRAQNICYKRSEADGMLHLSS
jgi:hypothetical protein